MSCPGDVTTGHERRGGSADADRAAHSEAAASRFFFHLFRRRADTRSGVQSSYATGCPADGVRFARPRATGSGTSINIIATDYRTLPQLPRTDFTPASQTGDHMVMLASESSVQSGGSSSPAPSTSDAHALAPTPAPSCPAVAIGDAPAALAVSVRVADTGRPRRGRLPRLNEIAILGDSAAPAAASTAPPAPAASPQPSSPQRPTGATPWRSHGGKSSNSPGFGVWRSTWPSNGGRGPRGSSA